MPDSQPTTQSAGPTIPSAEPTIPSAEPTAPIASGELIVEDESDPTLAPTAPSEEECQAEFAETELRQVYLAFAFDVSGSMGKLDEEYHDPELKWKPVVNATKAFFAAETSLGLHASLTFFPASDDRCEQDSYLTPDVNMTTLPSDVFAQAIDDVTPKSEDDWRGGTPTLAVLQGTYSLMAEAMGTEPDAEHAVVLVTDGTPQGCDDDEDDLQTVAQAIADVAERIPTYVIGVSNPAGGPDTVSNLDAFATAGGTGSAFLIATGDPKQTADAFSMAIDEVRQNIPSCEATLPVLSAGRTIDVERVNVTMTRGDDVIQLGYDEDCEADLAWHFDDADAPTRIVLCDLACQSVRSGPATSLDVGFGCRRIPAAVR